uniref:MYND-type domain-containing protein n=2 Tax=Macrostomum lignano TaxID=282301 RepID=A0A1I8JE45_9PLAT
QAMSTMDKRHPSNRSASSTSNGNCASPFSLNFSASSGQAVAPSPSGFASVVTASDVVDEMQSLPLDQVPAAVKLLRRAFRQPQLKLIEDPSTLRQLIRLVHCQPVVSLNAMEDVARLTAQEARNRLLLNLARQPLVNYKRSTDFLDLMCCEYRGLCEMAVSQAPVASKLESEHLSAMGLTWRLVCEHSYECIIYSHENIRSLQKILLDKLRPPPDRPDTEIEPLRCLLILDGEMRRVRCKWEEAQPALARWREANKPSSEIPWPPDSCVTTPEDLALGSASGPFVTCERCSQTVCTCPNCTMSHYITCGVLAPRPTLDGSSTSLPYNDDDEEFEEKFMAIADGGAKEKSPASKCEHCGHHRGNKSQHQHHHASQAAQTCTQTAPANTGGGGASSSAVAATAPVSAGYHANRDRLRQKLKEKRKQQQPKQQSQQHQQQQQSSSNDIDELVRFIEGQAAAAAANNGANSNCNGQQAKGKRQSPAAAAGAAGSNKTSPSRSTKCKPESAAASGAGVSTRVAGVDRGEWFRNRVFLRNRISAFLFLT